MNGSCVWLIRAVCNRPAGCACARMGSAAERRVGRCRSPWSCDLQAGHEGRHEGPGWEYPDVIATLTVTIRRTDQTPADFTACNAAERIAAYLAVDDAPDLEWVAVRVSS